MTFLVTDENQRYECTDCNGFCCRNGYQITISNNEKERLLALQAVGETLTKKNVNFVPFPLREDTWILPQENVDGKQECAFLDDERLCVIHRQHGYDAKPEVCKAYPFSAMERQLSYTFQCKSIRENYGKPLPEAISNEETFIKSQSLPKSLPLRQSGGEECSQNDFLIVWENVRKGFLQSKNLEKVLLQHISHINGDFSEKAFHRSVPALFSFFWNMSVIAEPVAESFSTKWFRAFESCLNKLDLSDEKLEKEVLNPDFWKGLRIYQNEVPFVVQKDGAEALLQRYFLHVIDRKLFLRKSPSLFLALVSLLYCWEFLKLRAKILSIIGQEEDGVSKQTLEQAIIDTEGNFAFHKLAGENLFPRNLETLILKSLA